MRRTSPSWQGGDHEARRSRLARPRLRPVLPDRPVDPDCRLRLLAREQEEVRARRDIDPGQRGPAMALERDPASGYLTTGHEWNGLTELNTPVPRVVFFFLIVTFVFSLGYWVLMPAWPVGTTYTKGLLDLDDHVVVTEQVQEAAVERTA